MHKARAIRHDFLCTLRTLDKLVFITKGAIAYIRCSHSRTTEKAHNNLKFLMSDLFLFFQQIIGNFLSPDALRQLFDQCCAKKQANRPSLSAVTKTLMVSTKSVSRYQPRTMQIPTDLLTSLLRGINLLRNSLTSDVNFL